MWYKYVPEDTSHFAVVAEYKVNNDTYYGNINVRAITSDGKIVSPDYWVDANNSFGDNTEDLLFKGKTYFIGVGSGISASQTTATLEITDLNSPAANGKPPVPKMLPVVLQDRK